MKYILGIDTSCYTTSMAGVDLNGNIIFSFQKQLDVPLGERGLKQSTALFHHLNNLPILTNTLRSLASCHEIAAVCASDRPRPIEGSYMPVFQFSYRIGQSISDLLRVPFFKVSHQENHIMAGRYTARGPNSDQFLTFHLSGGTSELLYVSSKPSGFEVEIIGGTTDLSAGQFVDRIGVAMGLPFPAGPHLEKMASSGSGDIILNGSVKGTKISFSGPESQGQRLICQNMSYNEIAYAVYDLLVRTISKCILNAVKSGYPNEVLLVGGVSSSKILKIGLQERIKRHNRNIQLYFADPELSKDNAVGTALLGLKAYRINSFGMEEKDVYTD